jgi:hypothetical protein
MSLSVLQLGEFGAEITAEERGIGLVLIVIEALPT